MRGFGLFRNLFKSETKEPTERRQEARVDAREGLRILIVDDSATVVAVLGRMLTQARYETYSTDSGEAALESLNTCVPELIFLDIVLPGMSGFAALRALRRDPRTAQVPVIMISGNLKATEEFYGQRIGADDFMKKPFGRTEVFSRIQRLIEKGRLPRREAPAEPLDDELLAEETVPSDHPCGPSPDGMDDVAQHGFAPAQAADASTPSPDPAGEPGEDATATTSAGMEADETEQAAVGQGDEATPGAGTVAFAAAALLVEVGHTGGHGDVVDATAVSAIDDAGENVDVTEAITATAIDAGEDTAGAVEGASPANDEPENLASGPEADADGTRAPGTPESGDSGLPASIDDPVAADEDVAPVQHGTGLDDGAPDLSANEGPGESAHAEPVESSVDATPLSDAQHEIVEREPILSTPQFDDSPFPDPFETTTGQDSTEVTRGNGASAADLPSTADSIPLPDEGEVPVFTPAPVDDGEVHPALRPELRDPDSKIIYEPPWERD